MFTAQPMPTSPNQVEPRKEEPWETAVRDKLRSMLEDPLTTKTAAKISRFAQTAGELTAIAHDEITPQKWRGSGLGGLTPLNNWNELDTPITPIVNNPAETFGAKVLREAMAAYQKTQRAPEKLVTAIALAKENGLDDVAEQLTKELLLQEDTIQGKMATIDRQQSALMSEQAELRQEVAKLEEYAGNLAAAEVEEEVTS